MKLFLAGEREIANAVPHLREKMRAAVRRRLFSYYYHGYSGGPLKSSGGMGSDGLTSGVRESVEQGHDLFLDSGAFTAFTKGAVIDIEEYANFIQRCGSTWGTVSNLDVIGGDAAAKTYENQKRLEALGANVCPVFHTDEDEKWLVKYLDEGYPYIFLGGMVPKSTGWLLEWLDRLWTVYLCKPDGTARVKVHGFGLTDQLLMLRYPWYSVDSSSWLMTGIFGACVFRDGRRLRKVVFSDESPQARKFRGWHYNSLSPVEKKVVDGWLTQYGVTAEQVGGHYSYRDVINAMTFQNIEDLGATRFVPDRQSLFA